MRRGISTPTLVCGLALAAVLAVASGCAGPAPSYGTASGAPEPIGPAASAAPGGPSAEAQVRPSDAVLPTLDAEAGPEDYQVYAALNNPGLEAAFNRWRAALERVPQATALPDPMLTYSYSIRGMDTMAELAQMFPWFGKQRLRGDAAGQAAESARLTYEAEKLDLFYRVASAYAEYYYAARSVEVVRAQRDLVVHLEEALRTRYETNAATYADLVRVQVELARLEDQLRSAEDLRGPLAADLNAALNRPTEAELPWPQALPDEALDAGDPQVLAWLEEGNPELAALDHESEGERDAIELARKDYWPDVTLGLQWTDTSHPIVPVPGAGKDPVVAMVSINLPIWRGKLDAAVREARARYRAAVSARRERGNALAARAKMALYGLRDAERKIDLYRDTLVPKGQQSLGASQTAYLAGEAPFLDVVDALRALLDFQLGYERALSNRTQRMAELDMLAGRTLPRTAQPPTGN